MSKPVSGYYKHETETDSQTDRVYITKVWSQVSRVD